MKKKRSKRLEPVVNHASRQEQEAAKIFAEAQKRVTESEQQLEQLIAFRDEYLAGYGQAGQTASSISRLLDYQAFLAKLNQGIGQANRSIEVSRQQKELLKQQWLQRRTRHQALNTVLQKCQQQEQKAEEYKEQLAVEELVRLRHYNHH